MFLSSSRDGHVVSETPSKLVERQAAHRMLDELHYTMVVESEQRPTTASDKALRYGHLTAAQISEFEDSRHVQVVPVIDGTGARRLDYRLNADGKQQSLFQTEASPAGLAEANKRLDNLTLSMVTDLESSTARPVTFSRPGEDVVHKKVYAPGGNLVDGPMVKARMPQLDELYGIRAALEHSSPSNLTADGKPVKIYFLADSFMEGLGLNVAAQVQDKNDNQAIYMSPDGARISNAKATEADLTADEQSKSWLVRPPTIESDLVHEFSHVAQGKLNLLHAGTDIDDGIATRMGWIHFVDDSQQIDTWMIKLRDKDKNGDNVLYREDESNPFGGWYRCDKKGFALDKNGDPVTGSSVPQAMGQPEVYSDALVKPPTWYFPNPCEEYAEAMKLYRLSVNSRQALLTNSPSLYTLIKGKDQEELDMHYKGMFIRELDGTLVTRSDAATARIDNFERAAHVAY